MRVARLLAALTILVASIGAFAPAAGASAPSSTLRLGIVGAPILDPALADSPQGVSLAQLLWTPLTTLEPSTGAVQPGLARRWKANPEQTEFTFTLRRGLRFHDGAALDATAVKTSLDRVANPATKSPLARLLAPVDGYVEARGGAAGLRGITATDPRTLVIKTSAPTSTLPMILGHPALGITGPATTKLAPGIPNGSGPYRETGQDPALLTLRRVGGGPRVRTITVRSFETAAAARDALRVKQLDIAPLSREEKAEFGKGLRPLSAPYLAVGYYALNLRDPRFANPAVRTAILHALDSSALSRAAYGSAALPATGIIPVGVPGSSVTACRDVCDFDLDAAKTDATTSYLAGGPPVFIDFDDNAVQRAMATEAQKELAAAGIASTLRPHLPQDYDDFIVNGSPQIFRLGWIGDYPSGVPFLSPLFTTGAPENVTHVASPSADLLVAASLRAARPRVQAKSLVGAERAVLEQAVVKPVSQFRTRYLTSTRVRGVEVDSLGGLFGGVPRLAG